MTVKISAIEGNRQRLDGGAMFGNAPRLVWQKWLAPDPQHRIELACRALLVEYHDLKVLGETGIGAFFPPTLAERYGVQTPDVAQLLRSLEKIRVSENEITHVVLSHLHFDHAGGLMPTYEEQQQGKTALNYPQPPYVVGQGAWERALHPHPRDRASFIPGLTDRLLASGRLDIIPHGQVSLPFAPEVFQLRYSSGHTPEQMHMLVKGAGDAVLFCGDLIPGLAWLHTPITMGYDRYPELLIDEKAELSAQAADENWFLFFTHDPSVAMSRCSLQASDGKILPRDQHASFSGLTI
jgi:glyoxylase-like metal-dependent hydrolase (beta-lactamase superfamily II)